MACFLFSDVKDFLITALQNAWVATPPPPGITASSPKTTARITANKLGGQLCLNSKKILMIYCHGSIAKDDRGKSCSTDSVKNACGKRCLTFFAEGGEPIGFHQKRMANGAMNLPFRQHYESWVKFPSQHCRSKNMSCLRNKQRIKYAKAPVEKYLLVAIFRPASLKADEDVLFPRSKNAFSASSSKSFKFPHFHLFIRFWRYKMFLFVSLMHNWPKLTHCTAINQN